MTRPTYSFSECIALLKNCRIDELAALSFVLIEERPLYPLHEQWLLLVHLRKRRRAIAKQFGIPISA